MNTDEVIELIRGGELVKFSDVLKVLKRISVREDFRYSDKDWDIYGKPLLTDLECAIKAGKIECYAAPEDALPEGGHIYKSDLVAFIIEQPLPDGGKKLEVPRHEWITFPVKGQFDENLLGELQKLVEKKIPNRSPSVEVKGKYIQTDKLLNMKDSFFLAVGYAPNANGTEDYVPSVTDTLEERAAIEKLRANRKIILIYRGVCGLKGPDGVILPLSGEGDEPPKAQM